jgi:FKBP-type peptidyl-prolyl cis-trans isomerase SlyD
MCIAKDRVVSIDYTLRDLKNRFIDSTSGSEFLDYLHGYENIIPGLERALEGRARGDRIQVTIPAADAYGLRDETLVADVSLDRFQDGDTVEAGMQFHIPVAGGLRMVTVTQVLDRTARIDGNHPLAGMDLNFDVTVMAVREASEEELVHGNVQLRCHDCCGACGAGCGAGCGAECGVQFNSCRGRA